MLIQLNNLKIIQSIYRILTPYEASSLVALLHTRDCEILERALVTVSNTSAFSANQVLKRKKCHHNNFNSSSKNVCSKYLYDFV